MEKRKNPQTKYAKVWIDAGKGLFYTYLIPSPYQDKLEAGCRVKVRLQRREMTGVVVEIKEEVDTSKIYKPVDSLIDETPLFSSDFIDFTRELAYQQCVEWGEILKNAFPSYVRERKFHLHFLEEEISTPFSPLPSLSPQEKKVAEEVLCSLREGKHEVFLLHMGEERNKIYLKLLQEVLRQGKNALILFPEIFSHLPFIQMLEEGWGEVVSFLYPYLTPSKKFQEWKKIREKRKRIVVGARSSLFAPLDNIGLIIVEEEHHSLHKQEKSPRFHAREGAILRGKLNKAVVVLGSATPSLDSFYKGEKGEVHFLSLFSPHRDLPPIKIVDMRREREEGNFGIFSRQLIHSMERALREGKKIFLFINRKGYSSRLLCPRCGHIQKCKNCGTPLTFHSSIGKMVCHHCGWEEEPEKICPQCLRSYTRLKGIGTEKVEKEIHRIFPNARTLRCDQDSWGGEKNREEFLKEVDIVVGTKIFLKYLPFFSPSLGGIISADFFMHLPDFRGAEHIFQLIASLGLRISPEGEVIVQTFYPHQYSLRYVSSYDFLGFWREELKRREELGYPPVTTLLSLTVRGYSENKVIKIMEVLKSLLREKITGKKLQLIGPLPCIRYKVGGKFRWRLIIKGDSREEVADLMKDLAAYFPKLPLKGCFLSVDLNPIELL